MSQPSVDTKIYNKAYRAFFDAKQRCNNPKHPRYADWGGRGITVKFNSFADFLQEVGFPKPTDSIDREDNDGHYEKGNVRWTDRSTQQLNKRLYKQNTSGMAGVRQVKARGLITETFQAYVNVKGKFIQLYVGPSFDDACAARKHFNETKKQS